MIYTPPNYQGLYNQQQKETETWRNAAELFRTTLRDQFAMAALTGMFAADTEDCHLGMNNEILRARGCYKMADAMIKARKEQS